MRAPLLSAAGRTRGQASEGVIRESDEIVRVTRTAWIASIRGEDGSCARSSSRYEPHEHLMRTAWH
jgi:hypothetical protein